VLKDTCGPLANTNKCGNRLLNGCVCVVQNDVDVILTLAAVWCEVIKADSTLGAPGATNARWAVTRSRYRMTTNVASVCTVTWNATSSHVVKARLQCISTETTAVYSMAWLERQEAQLNARGGRPYCPQSYKYNHAVRIWEVDMVGRQKIVIPSGIGLAAVLAVGHLCLSLYGKLWTVHC